MHDLVFRNALLLHATRPPGPLRAPALRAGRPAPLPRFSPARGPAVPR